jgi:ribonuclease E
VLPLTPPETPATRVANDPRERRRLAKLAAEQAHEQAKQAQAVPKAETGNEQGAEIEAVASETVASATEAPETVVLPEQSLETATPVSKQKATAPTETAQPEVKAELEKVSKQLKLNLCKLN